MKTSAEKPAPEAGAKRRRVIRRVLGAVLLIPLALLGLALLAFVAIQTPPAKRLIAARLSERLTRPELDLRIAGLSGLLPFRFHAASIAAADRDGEWLIVSNLSAVVAPAPLLEGVVLIESLSAQTLELARIPAALPAADDKPAAGGRAFGERLIVRRFSVRELSASLPQTQAPVRVTLRGALPEGLDGRVELTVSSLGRMPPPLDTLTGPDGSAEAELTITGQSLDLTRLELASDRLDLHASGAAYDLGDAGLRRGYLSARAQWRAGRLAGRAAAGATLEGSVVAITNLAAVSGMAEAAATASYNLQSGALQAKGRVHVPELSKLLPPDAPALQGAVSCHLHLTGSPERADLHARLEAERLSGYGLRAPAAEGSLRIRQKRADAQASIEAELHAPVLTAAGQAAPVLPPAAVNITADSSNGALRASVSISAQPGSVDASADIPLTLALPPAGFSARLEAPAALRLAAQLDLAFLNTVPALADHRFRGRIRADAHMRPAAAAINRISGTCSVEAGEYQYLPLGLTLRDIGGRGQFDQGRLVVPELTANDGAQGQLSAQGAVRVLRAEGFPFEAELLLNDAMVLRREGAQASISGSVSCNGSLTGLVVRSRTVLQRGEILLDRLSTSAPDLEIVEKHGSAPRETREAESAAREAESAARAPAPPVAIDATLELPDRLFIRSRLLDSLWEGSLRVSKTPQTELLLLGELRNRRGRYTFFGRQFRIEQGRVLFGGPLPPRPLVEVTAVHEQADLIARLKAYGTVPDLSLELTSVPSLPQDEIMARVLFGRDLASLTPLQALRLAAAVRSLTAKGEGGLDVMEWARDFLGVDELEISEASADSDAAAEVGVRKYLSSGAYLELKQPVGSRGARVRLEYEVTPHISVETESGHGMRSGGGINWKWDF